MADVGQNGQACFPNGTCNEGLVCEAGTCAAGPAMGCTPSAVSCEGNAIRICNSGGTGFNTIPCASGEICVAGMCRDQLCEPDRSFCDGRKVLQCNAEGSNIVAGATVDCELAGLFCSSGGCTRGECDPACDANQYCDDSSACQAHVCTPGSATCDGDVSVLCNDQGSMATRSDCAAGNQVCRAGACVAPTTDAGVPADTGVDSGVPGADAGQPDANPGLDAAGPRDASPSNQPPTAPVVAIQPSNPRTDDDLDCVITALSVDPDGDNVTYRHVWLRGGVFTGITTPTAPSSATAAGEDWMCIVTPNDGAVDGPSGSASTTILANTVPGLVAHWAFDDAMGTTAADSSGNGNHGTLLNMNPADDWVRSRFASGLDFDGSNDFVQSRDIDLSGDFTLSAWIRFPDNAAALLPIISKQTSTANPINGSAEFVLQVNGGNLNFFIGNGSGNNVFINHTRNPPLRPGNWNHVAVTVAGTRVHLFIGGRNVATTNLSAPTQRPSANLPVLIGSHSDAQGPHYFEGQLDEVRIYDRALSFAEVMEHFVGIRVMAPIAAGTFMMGSPPTEAGRDPNESQHSVTLTRPFWISKHEITQEQVVLLLGTFYSGLDFCRNCPTENLSWHVAARVANRVSNRTGLPDCYTCDANRLCSVPTDVYACPGYRLPTEAEWEYAVRAGVGASFSNGGEVPTGQLTECNNPVILTNAADLRTIAWYCFNSPVRTSVVGLLAPNAWGLFDGHGNVAEWTHDFFVMNPGTAPVTDPQGPSAGLLHTVRGGSWMGNPGSQRAAARRGVATADVSVEVGFRLARTMSP